PEFTFFFPSENVSPSATHASSSSPKTNAPKLLSHGPITAPRDPPPPSSETALGCRKNVNSDSSLPHLSLTLFNQSGKSKICQGFLLLHNGVSVCSEMGGFQEFKI
ncbi:hypothetical protein AABB24_007638, partial [Solanum stoloniferum]